MLFAPLWRSDLTMPLVDAEEIGTAHGLTADQVRGLYAARKSNGFPPARGKRPGAGKRPQSEWEQAEVDAWFAERARRKSEGAPSRRATRNDPGELLTAAEIGRRLGYKKSDQISTYYDKGVFIEPDEEEVLSSGRVRRRWRAERVDAWNAKRPGRGRRATSTAPQLPKPSAGAPDDLIGAAEAARVLGLNGVGSFDSTLYKGDLPLLTTPASTTMNGRRVRRWRRGTVERQVEQRRPHAPVPENHGPEDVLLPAEEVAQLLGYANAKSLRTMIARGALPHLARPDDPGPPARWKKAAVLAQARAKAGHVG
ncbi:hypothetical protein ACWIGE_14710 [Streptomyces diastaticus]